MATPEIDDERRGLYLESYLQDLKWILPLSAGLGGFWFAYAQTTGNYVDLTFSIASITCFIVGRLADLKTTEIGLSAGCIEINPDVPANPTIKDLYRRDEHIKGSIGVAISGIFPPAGIVLGIRGIKTAIENWRDCKAT